MIDVNEYKNFIGIDSFPAFDVQYFIPDISCDYFFGAWVNYDAIAKTHTLMLPKNYEISKFLLFHELTHISDMNMLATGDKNYDFCLSGYMEYHASQVELMVMMGAKRISDVIAFSMEELVDNSEWTVQIYLDNKYNTARSLIKSTDQHTRVDGMNAFFNFLGLKSVCAMYSSDFKDNYTYLDFVNCFSTVLFSKIKKTYSGWIYDIDRAVDLYSHTFKAVIL